MICRVHMEQSLSQAEHGVKLSEESGQPTSAEYTVIPSVDSISTADFLPCTRLADVIQSTLFKLPYLVYTSCFVCMQPCNPPSSHLLRYTLCLILISITSAVIAAVSPFCILWGSSLLLSLWMSFHVCTWNGSEVPEQRHRAKVNLLQIEWSFSFWLKWSWLK